MTAPRFGDLVLNHHASKRNPLRVGMVLRAERSALYCLARDGQRFQFGHGWQDHIEKVGSLDFATWDAALDAAGKEAT